MATYDYAKLQFFQVVPSESPTGHVVLPAKANALAGAKANDLEASVILSVHLGAIDPTLQGVNVPFLELPPVITSIDLQRQSDGRYALLGAKGYKVVRDLVDVINRELEEPIASQIADIEARLGTPAGSAVAFRGPVTEAEHQNPLGWCRGDDIYWCQSAGAKGYGVHGPEWMYAGCVSADFYFGSVYGFFNRDTEHVRLVFECT